MRKRAAETLLSLVRYLGPQIETGSTDRQRIQRCLAYLREVKTDKVKPTRDSLSKSVAAYEQLASWVAQNPVRALNGGHAVAAGMRTCCPMPAIAFADASFPM